MKKVYFLNLAVKMKLHLDDLDHPQKGGTDRQSLLDFYDNFPHNPKFRFIKPRDFKMKPVRSSAIGKKTETEDWDEFGEIPDRVNRGGIESDEDGSVGDPNEAEDS